MHKKAVIEGHAYTLLETISSLAGLSAPGRKASLKSGMEYGAVLVDVPESLIERLPKSKSDTIPEL